MPISKKWSPATAQHIKRNAPEKKGVYELKSFGEVVYVGQTTNLQNRLLTHLNSKNPNYYRFKTLGFFSSPENEERKHYNRLVEDLGRPPRWNKKKPKQKTGFL